MGKIPKEAMFQWTVFLYTLTKLGNASEVKKNSIYLIKEKWLLNIDVAKLKKRQFNKFKNKFNNSKPLPKMDP